VHRTVSCASAGGPQAQSITVTKYPRRAYAAASPLTWNRSRAR
jgi:hypothetical protein